LGKKEAMNHDNVSTSYQELFDLMLEHQLLPESEARTAWSQELLERLQSIDRHNICAGSVETSVAVESVPATLWRDEKNDQTLTSDCAASLGALELGPSVPQDQNVDHARIMHPSDSASYLLM
jgi:hypothetical protein